MADRAPLPRKPVNRRSYFSSSISSEDSHQRRSNYTSSRVSQEASRRNWDSGDSYVTDKEDADRTFSTLAGNCPFMCPVEERARRERLRDLAVFERLHGNPAKTSANLAVKKFCRTISTKDVKASDVRPVSVLEGTLDYLLSLLHSSGRPFEVVHDFIFDRTRSIRQDLSMQNAASPQVIRMYERMVTFHIISHSQLHRSCGSPDIASMCHLNLEQLMKTLATLLNLYEVNRVSHSASRKEAEFCSFYLLLRLASDNQGEPLTLWISRIPSPILKSKEMCFARGILRYYRLGNYKRFILTIEEEASYLQYCILEPYINEVRILALSCIIHGGYKLQPYPLVDLSKLLMMKESDVESLCTDCALELANDGIGKGLVSTKQSTMSKPSGGFQKYYPMDSERLERLCAGKLEL
ncbi:SAC3 family protein C [Andrographis paniculata]|uniref:SAC3 family protein C n=1 Tax=Andrographis paniculata TaxID=175694 RepID=UPI0021E84697|nr:SAC3 family protein C [Andrographis paniculata]